MKKSVFFTLSLIFICFFSTVLVAQVTVNLVASEDTYLSSANTTFNYGSVNLFKVTNNSSATKRGALLRWDLSSIPSNAVVNSVSMTVYVSTSSTQTYNLYNMRRSWVEGTLTTGAASTTSANWQTYDGTNAWGTVGAASTTNDRYNVNLWGAGTTSFSSTGSKTINLNSDGIAIVQGWIAGTTTNYGLTMQSYSTTSGSDDLQISSSENTTTANRPKLNVTYTVTSTDPTITTTGTLTPFSSLPGVPSAVQTYTVAGSNLTQNINIASPAGFEISLSSGSGFGSSLTLTQSGGAVATTTIYVRLNQATEGTPSGNITHTSTGATQKDVAVSGTVSSSLTVSLEPSADTYLSGVNTTNNYGASVTLKSTLDADNPRGALFSWDVSGIPANANVTSVSLTLYISTAAPQTYNLYNMRRSWVEGTGSGSVTGDGATWQTYNGTTSWGTNGAANTTSDRFDINLWGAGTSSFSSTGSKTVTFNSDGITVVQGWLSGAISNYGLTMQNYSSSTSINDDLQFASSENTTTANRPKLNITYSISTSPSINTIGTMAAFSCVPGSPSSEQNYIVSGTNLTDDILITAPADFEISKTSGSGFSSSLILSQTGGTVSATTIYARFFRATAGTSSGNIANASNGATTQNKAVSGTATLQSASWTAYDDGAYIDGQISTNITTFQCYTNNTSGLLKKYSDGSNTPVTVLVTTSGTIASQLSSDQYGSETNTGTDAYTTFHAFANMIGGMRLGTSASYVDLTFTGLDQAKTYTFATTANRNNSASDYVTRITKFTISDLDAATNASTSGVTVNSNLSVSFSTGYNTENGYVARWTDIQPGTDGDFKVRFEVNSGDYAYGPAVFMLQEGSGEVPVQYTLTLGNDGHGTVSLSPTGGIYNEGTSVTLTPVPNNGYEFSTWSGTNGDDPTDNNNGTWTLVMDANKSISGNFALKTENTAPNQPVLVQPLNNAIDISTPPTLSVTVSDPNTTDNLDVSFYGRAKSTSSGEDFTIVVIPDPQNYATSYPAVYNSQTQWISDNKIASNIVFATAVGDLVNTSSSSTEYANADAAFDKLDAGNVQYSVSPGNHDMSMGSTLWPTYFGASRFSGKSWYGGSLDDYNSYSLISAPGMDFIIINLQYSPGTTQLNWADALMKSNSSRRAIVVQHDILNIDNSWVNQASFTALKDNPNLFLMLCGHMHSASDGAAYRAEPGDDGHTIHIVMADYQDFSGSGYLRLLRFSPTDDIIYMTTYSPYTSASITTSPDQMNLTYDLASVSASAYTLIGNVNDIVNGANASIAWSGRENNIEYEWYTTVSDGSLTTTGATWSFTTGSTAVNYTLSAGNNGNGSVTINPSGGTYNSGTSVTLTPVPNSGYQFSSWTGTNSGDVINTSGIYTIVMNGNKSVTANFTQIQYLLTAGSNGHGSVTLTPSGGSYAAGTTVTLTPVPDVGYQFSTWSGANSGNIINNSGIYTIVMNGDRAITANFSQIQYTLTAGNDAHGSVNLTPSGGTYASETTVTLTPSPNSGYEFSSWSGTNASNIINTSGVYTIVMNGNKTVTANFSLIPSITVTSPNGGESWQVGSGHNITWSSTGITGNVHIEYSINNGSVWSDVIASTSNAGSYSWTIPNTTSVNCIVRVSDLDGTPSDVSDAVFIISAVPYLTVLSPDGGEDWKIGSSHSIFWTSNGTSGNVQIEYSTNNGTNWISIISITTDDGSYIWTIPDNPSTSCIIRVSDTDASPQDVSNSTFTISAEPDIHFTPVWSGNGFDHMNFYALTAAIDGVDLQPGDEIGIFDGTYCVGSGKLTQILNGINYLEIRVSADDPTTPETDGYISGHNATFKIWDASAHNEISSVQITYETGSNNILSSGASSWYHISGVSLVNQEITLSNGWSIFSLYVTPENTNMLQVVKSLIDAGTLVKIQNESGAALEYLSGTSSWINNIGNWSNTEGYKIRVNAPTTLLVGGIPISDPVDISLSSGWNIISYPVSSSQPAMPLLNDLISSGSLVKVQDQAGSAIELIGGNWLNNIGSFDPGEGYKVRLSANDVLTIKAAGSGTKGNLKSASTTVHTEFYRPVWEGNGLDHMNIYISEISDGVSGMEPGDEIGIFDGPICVGSTIINNTSEKFHSMVVSADDPITKETDGFIAGHSMSFRIWRPSTNREVNINDIDYYPGSSKAFVPMGTTIISMNTTGIDIKNDLDITTTLGDNYPNPFSHETKIPYTVGVETKVDIAIYNILGNRLSTVVHGIIPSGKYIKVWNANDESGKKVSSGVYFCKMVAGNKVIVKKIILK